MSPSRWHGLERRNHRTRLAHPACPVCQAPPDEMRVTIRRAKRVYFKCNRCKYVMTIDIPKREGS